MKLDEWLDLARDPDVKEGRPFTTLFEQSFCHKTVRRVFVIQKSPMDAGGGIMGIEWGSVRSHPLPQVSENESQSLPVCAVTQPVDFILSARSAGCRSAGFSDRGVCRRESSRFFMKPQNEENLPIRSHSGFSKCKSEFSNPCLQIQIIPGRRTSQ